MMIMLIMTWTKIITSCCMMIGVLRSVRCLSYSYHAGTEFGIKMAPCKAMPLGWCALGVFEWKSCACLSPFIPFSVSKEISLVNLLHSQRCSDSHMLINHHLYWFFFCTLCRLYVSITLRWPNTNICSRLYSQSRQHEILYPTSSVQLDINRFF